MTYKRESPWTFYKTLSFKISVLSITRQQFQLRRNFIYSIAFECSKFCSTTNALKFLEGGSNFGFRCRCKISGIKYNLRNTTYDRRCIKLFAKWNTIHTDKIPSFKISVLSIARSCTFSIQKGFPTPERKKFCSTTNIKCIKIEI